MLLINQLDMVLWIVAINFAIFGGAEILTIKSPRVLIPQIVGGKETKIESYPYAVQLFHRQVHEEIPNIASWSFNCGAVIVSTWHILTAAHCLTNHNRNFTLQGLKPFSEYCPSSVYARVGATNLDHGGSIHKGAAIIINPGYNYVDDIGILIVARAVAYNHRVQPAVLPPQGYQSPDEALVVAVGWGFTQPSTSPDRKLSPILNHVTVKTVNIMECINRYKNYSYRINDRTMCAGHLDVGGKDACGGDSGGPLIHDGVVIGITAWGLDCADPKYPGAYTMVASFTNWINDVILATTSKSPSMPDCFLLALSYL